MKILSSVVALCALITLPLHAANYTTDILLEGLQEVPPNASPGTGTASVTFDDLTGLLSINGGLFSGLLGTTVAAHVHGYSGPGVSAPVIIPLTSDLGVTAGSFSGSGLVPLANVPDVLAGLTYVNVHSTVFPGGEIRGQIVGLAVPDAGSSLALFTIALASLAPFRRKLA